MRSCEIKTLRVTKEPGGVTVRECDLLERVAQTHA